MNPRTELEKRYPKADLGKLAIYFRHLVACKTVKSLYTHEHHICPVAQFPEFEFDFPENKITLTKEDHAFAHKLLAAAIPELCNLAPWIAAGDPSKAGKIGGKIAAQIHKKNGTGPYSKEHQMRGAKAGGAAAVASGQILSLVTPENCTAGGRAAGKVAVESGQILALAKSGLGGKTGGKIVGLANVKSGHWNKVRAIGRHTHWHVNRGITNLVCALCLSQPSVIVEVL